MSRRTARKHIFTLVFQIPFYEDFNMEETRLMYVSALDVADAEDVAFMTEETDGIVAHLEEIDALVVMYTDNYQMSRLSKVDLAIVRLAVYELFYAEDIPCRVTMNEAVELAKTFGTDNAPVFINGILAKIYADNEEKIQKKVSHEA